MCGDDRGWRPAPHIGDEVCGHKPVLFGAAGDQESYSQESPPAASSGEKDLRDPGGRTGISRRVKLRPRPRTTSLGTILQRDHAAARASQHRQPLRSARASAPDVRTCFCRGRSEAFAVRSTWQRTRSGSRRRVGGQSYTRSSTVVAKGTRAPAVTAVLLVAVLRWEGDPPENACSVNRPTNTRTSTKNVPYHPLTRMEYAISAQSKISTPVGVTP